MLTPMLDNMVSLDIIIKSNNQLLSSSYITSYYYLNRVVPLTQKIMELSGVEVTVCFFNATCDLIKKSHILFWHNAS